MLRPVAQYTYTFHISTGSQRSLHMLTHLVGFFGYFVYMESASYIDLKDIVTFIAMVYMIPCTQESLEESWTLKQNAQVTQLLKDQIFNFDFESANKFQNQMDLIYTELGKGSYYQIVEDCLISNNPKAVNHLAPSIMPTRKKFDPNYYKITSEWAGGYPRPMVEVSESLWDFSEAARLIQGPQAA